MVVDRFRKLVETWDATLVDDLYTEDAFVDANVPSWRFQRQGVEEIREQYESWSPEGHRLVEWRPRSFPGGAIVETAVLEHEGTEEELYTREVHILSIADDRISEHTLYCTGPWDLETVDRQRAEAPMIRP